MHHRKLVTNTTCPRCGRGAETSDHLFRECPVSVECPPTIVEYSVVRSGPFVETEMLESVRGKLALEQREWSHPPGSIVKINFDSAYDGRHYKLASGIVARNTKGIVLLSCLEIHKEVASTFAAEALACRKAVQIGIEMQWPKIIIEGDSLAIIKKCQLKVKTDHKSANGLAHILATDSLKKSEEFYLLKNVPRYAEKQKKADWMREPD
ncbi:hypothetical protein Goklo_016546 [Gossypium klotzschianum]|uniref:RNase H type-1 domain-containing protein n=1 Tax=Gossypium klotzschianum TaxID=34286 RepID=A0A7J8UEU4_9ROSI|nr:hypothetical protein [Gossypium klotzschianum]